MSTAIVTDGMGLQDLYAAELVLQRALARGIGVELPDGTFRGTPAHWLTAAPLVSGLTP